MVARGELQRLLAGDRDVGLVPARPEVDLEGLADPRIVLDDERSHARSLQADDDGRAAAGRVLDRRSRRPSPRRTPSCTASPSPTPSYVARAPSPSRWNGWNTASRWSRGMPGTPVDDPDVDALLRSAPPRPATAVPSGAQSSALLITFASARSRSDGSADADGQRRRERATSTADASTERLASARVDRGVDRDRLRCRTPSMPGLEAAHVEQVRHEGVQPVGFRVDRLAERPHVVGGPLDVGAQQAGRRGLDVGERRPEVVRHRGEQRVADVVRLGQRGGGRGLGLEPQRGLDAVCSWATNAPRSRRSSAASVRPETTSIEPSHELGRVRTRRRASSGAGSPADADTCHPSIVGASTRDRVDVERASQLDDESVLRASSSRIAVTDASSASASTSAWPRASCALRRARAGRRGRSRAPTPRRRPPGPARRPHGRSGGCASVRCRTSRRGGT